MACYAPPETAAAPEAVVSRFTCCRQKLRTDPQLYRHALQSQPVGKTAPLQLSVVVHEDDWDAGLYLRHLATAAAAGAVGAQPTPTPPPAAGEARPAAAASAPAGTAAAKAAGLAELTTGGKRFGPYDAVAVKRADVCTPKGRIYLRSLQHHKQLSSYLSDPHPYDIVLQEQVTDGAYCLHIVRQPLPGLAASSSPGKSSGASGCVTAAGVLQVECDVLVAKQGKKCVVVTIPPPLQASLLHKTKPPYSLRVTVVEPAARGNASSDAAGGCKAVEVVVSLVSTFNTKSGCKLSANQRSQLATFLGRRVARMTLSPELQLAVHLAPAAAASPAAETSAAEAAGTLAAASAAPEGSLQGAGGPEPADAAVGAGGSGDGGAAAGGADMSVRTSAAGGSATAAAAGVLDPILSDAVATHSTPAKRTAAGSAAAAAAAGGGGGGGGAATRGTGLVGRKRSYSTATGADQQPQSSQATATAAAALRATAAAALRTPNCCPSSQRQRSLAVTQLEQQGTQQQQQQQCDLNTAPGDAGMAGVNGTTSNFTAQLLALPAIRVKSGMLSTAAPAAAAAVPAALGASGVASNATIPPSQGGQGPLQQQQQQGLDPQQRQPDPQHQQQLLQQYLGQEMCVKVHCAADSNLVAALNEMCAIALGAISGSSSSSSSAGPGQQQQVLLQYLQLEMRVKAHCAADVGLVQALNAICAIAMGAITRQGA